MEGCQIWRWSQAPTNMYTKIVWVFLLVWGYENCYKRIDAKASFTQLNESTRRTFTQFSKKETISSFTSVPDQIYIYLLLHSVSNYWEFQKDVDYLPVSYYQTNQTMNYQGHDEYRTPSSYKHSAFWTTLFYTWTPLFNKN